MKSRLEKLLAAARAHRAADDTPPVPPGLGRRLARQASTPRETDGAWLRGLAYGLVVCALAAACSAMLPRAPRESVPVEFLVLAGAVGENDDTLP